MKVVRLLQDMHQELAASLEDDKAVHEQLGCWCSSNSKEKTQSIEEGEANQNQLEAALGEAVGRMDEFKSKREATSDEVNRDEAALQEASALRMKESQEFHKEEVNLMEASKACAQALVVLREHSGDFVQVRAVAKKLRDSQVLRLAKASPQASALRSFLSRALGSPSAAFLAVPGYQSYAPQSGQIVGILETMKADFDDDLADAQARERKAAKEFAELRSAKEEEISTGRRMKADLDGEIAGLKEKHAEAFKELENTKRQLEIDRNFMQALEKQCSESSAEFDQRVKDRLAEIAAVEETISILNSDEAFANFDKTVTAAFFQVDATSSTAAAQRERLGRAATMLSTAAARVGAPALALLADRARLDSFAKVKEAIDKMVAELKQQQADEVDRHDWCIEGLNKNNRSLEAGYDKKESLQAKIADLEKTLDTLEKSLEDSAHEVAETKVQMKRASEIREAEHKDFQQTVTDQRLTQMALNKAHARMSKVYELLQRRAAQASTEDSLEAPAEFGAYEKNAGGGRVLRMLEEVIADSKKAEADAMRAEQESQASYEEFMKDSNKVITQRAKEMSDMKGAKASAEESLVMAQSDIGHTVTALEDLHQAGASLHSSCDFVLKNFDARQAARAAEMDALSEAKAILSGAK